MSHSHQHSSQQNETKTWRVFVLTFIMMFVEIGAGYMTGSMALLADGWHMGTHAAAFGITIFAYRYARRNVGNQRFSFGPGKVTTLGGFASAIALAVVALFMIIESIERFIEPVSIQFSEAIIVAISGLIVNVVSAIILMGTSLKDHTHSHAQKDLNLRSAYFHVLADALTSILAIAALLMGKYLGWQAMDPLMGIVGALVILRWSKGLIVSTSGILLDRASGGELEYQIRTQIELEFGTPIQDLKMWFIGPEQVGVAIRLKSSGTELNDSYVKLKGVIPELAFLILE